MHPAFSVIFLTTLIGAGQGLFMALVSGQVYSLANLLAPQDSVTFYATGSLLALVLLLATWLGRRVDSGSHSVATLGSLVLALVPQPPAKEPVRWIRCWLGP